MLSLQLVAVAERRVAPDVYSGCPIAFVIQVRVSAAICGLARHVTGLLLVRWEDIIAAGAKSRVGHLVLVDKVEVLLQIASLVEAHAARFNGADEGLLVAVDPQMGVEL